jgi:hypothetical protein
MLTAGRTTLFRDPSPHVAGDDVAGFGAGHPRVHGGGDEILLSVTGSVPRARSDGQWHTGADALADRRGRVGTPGRRQGNDGGGGTPVRWRVALQPHPAPDVRVGLRAAERRPGQPCLTGLVGGVGVVDEDIGGERGGVDTARQVAQWNPHLDGVAGKAVLPGGRGLLQTRSGPGGRTLVLVGVTGRARPAVVPPSGGRRVGRTAWDPSSRRRTEWWRG